MARMGARYARRTVSTTIGRTAGSPRRRGGVTMLAVTRVTRTDVRDVTIEKDRAVTITFGDGTQHTYGLVELRMNCPCATCRNHREVGEEAWPRPSSPQPLTVTDASFVGAWGLSITWNDGHATGIFPWESLRRWADEGRPAFPADSGFPADEGGEATTPDSRER